MRISDWSSDVCSSDLNEVEPDQNDPPTAARRLTARFAGGCRIHAYRMERLLLPLGRVCGPGLGASEECRMKCREADGRSEERRVGKECVSKCRSRGSRYH